MHLTVLTLIWWGSNVINMQLQQIYNALEFPRVSTALLVIWLDVVQHDFSFPFKRHFLEASSHIAQTHHSTVGVDNPTCLISSPDYQRLRETAQPEWQDWFMWVVPLPSALGGRWACLLIGSPLTVTSHCHYWSGSISMAHDLGHLLQIAYLSLSLRWGRAPLTTPVH